MKVLAAVCFSIAVMGGDSDRVVAATQTPPAEGSSCSYRLDYEVGPQAVPRRGPTWKPTEPELHSILARHLGWLQEQVRKMGGSADVLTHDEYLDHVNPAYSYWQREARSHPRQANLCHANLDGAYLRGANLNQAHLTGASLNGARLRGAHLIGAQLHGANLNDAELDRADLDSAQLDGAGLQAAQLNDADLSDGDLVGADLTNAQLYHTKLTRADLRGASLVSAHLRGADLYRAELNCLEDTVGTLTCASLDGADMSGAQLNDARLNGARLHGTDLSGANLASADLSGAELKYAHLTGTNLGSAHLNGADLSGADLSKANLAHVDLTGAIYAPVSAPPDPYVAGIKGLTTLELPSGEEIALVQLRKLLQDAGLRDEEREATYSIERNVTGDRISTFASKDRLLTFAWIEGGLRFVGFDVTTKYGLHPTYALGWILLLGAVLTPLYMRAMLHPAEEGRVIQVFPKDRPDRIDSETIDDKDRKVDVKATNVWNAFRAAAYFSLLSAVNIGFEQFNPGDWLSRLQSREYSLEAVGWVRIVAGAQSLLSVYLLAMWALTQFGRPFD